MNPKGNPQNLRRGGGRPKGLPNNATREQKAFFQSILESAAYRESFRRRVLRGEPGLETLMHHYALGKPKEQVEHSGAVEHTFYQWREPPTA